MNICYKCLIISCFFELIYTSSDTCAWFSWNNWELCDSLVMQQRDSLSRVGKRVIKSHDRLLMVGKRMIQSRDRLLVVDKRTIQLRDRLLMVGKRMIQLHDRPYTVSKRAGNARFNPTLLMCQRQSVPRRLCQRYPNVSGEALNNS